MRHSQLSWPLFVTITIIFINSFAFSGDIKEPNVAGQFYSANPDELSAIIDGFLKAANPEVVNGDVFTIISPHAGYDFSGSTAAYGYKLIQGKPYKTVVVIGASHYYPFKGISVYSSGKFRTPLGEIEIDSDFAGKITDAKKEISFVPQIFEKEHSVEVQLPFLQKVLKGFKIVPVIIGSVDFDMLKYFGDKIANVTAGRNDVLLVASSDFYHGYDWQDAEYIDGISIVRLEKMDAEGLYRNLNEEKAQMCGGLPVVAAVIAAKALGYDKIKILHHTNSADVTGNKTKGSWTVGYVSAVINREGNTHMELDIKQKNRLLEIARKTIEEYLKTGKTLEFDEQDPKLKEHCGAFVTLHKRGELRGCIGNIVGQKPLYVTIRDMAIQSSTQDPRFAPVKLSELKDIKIEISALSLPKKITDINEFQLGLHGVIVKRGWNSGVFLPQVATETGWSKEEFLSNLCAHKAGLPADAWKDKSCEIFIFSATVFSENQPS